MSAAELTRLRVAQAARTPVTIEQIREMLRADEAAENAGEERVAGIVDDWIDAGLLRAVGEDPVLYVQVPIFRDDISRRIAGHLLRPRTLLSLERELSRDVMMPNLREHGLRPLVGELAEAGLVASLGEVEDVDGLVDTIEEDDGVIDLHPSSAKLLRDRLGHERHSWEFEAGEFFVLTRKGLDALQVVA